MSEDVMRLHEQFEYRLPETPDWDQHPGQFPTRHAEKQLVMNLISRHQFAPCEVEHSHDLRRLCDARPSVRLKQAKILASHIVC